MQEQQTVLSVEELHISFAGSQSFTAVNHISFQLNKGETLAIVGESGSGKSLTALSLIGLLPGKAIQKGHIQLTTEDGVFDVNSDAITTLRGKAIGMVFQEPMSSLNPVMHVGKQIAESVVLHQQVSEKRAKEITTDWLAKVQLPNPNELYNRYPHQLSGGQKQRVMIAMAMCNNPVLLIADEPTTALDVTVQKEVLDLMAGLQKEHGTAMIFITHDLALAAQIADKIMVMQQGKAVEQGNAKEVLHNPVHPYTQALLACRPGAGDKGKRLPVVADFLNAETDAVLPLEYHTPIPTGDALLEVNNLKVWFTVESNWLGKPTEYFKAVNDVSFSLRKGEILGLVGESGCGKSTISRSLMGLLPVHEGQVLFNGEDLAALQPKDWRRIRRQIQLIFQDPFASLNPRMSIGDMLMEPLMVHDIVPKAERRKEALRLLDMVQLPADSMQRYPHQFSGGQRQRLGIARALAVRPQLLICDESVSALDVSVQAQIVNLLKDLQQEFKLSYLFISHDLNVVHYISDRVMVMQGGKIVETGNAEQVLKTPANDYTKKLIAAMP